MSDWRGLLACPSCGGNITSEQCNGCSAGYNLASSPIDLRLQRPKQVSVNFVLGETTDPLDRVRLEPLGIGPFPAPNVAIPKHLSYELISHIPRANRADAVALDLGCGDAKHRGVLEALGYRYVGVDYDAKGAPILADAHALPFGNGVFDVIISIAVLEHIRFPAVMMSEAYRVLKCGGTFVGTVAFLEPFHSNSYTHHTHLGTVSTLRGAGFDVEKVAPNPRWQVLDAQAKNGLFPGLPAPLVRSAVRSAVAVHRLAWKVARTRHAGLTELARLQKHAGAFAFVAHRPLGN